MVHRYIDNRLNRAVESFFYLDDSTKIELPLTKKVFIENLLICESVYLEINAMDERYTNKGYRFFWRKRRSSWGTWMGY